MATNENAIGVEARLDTKDFEAGTKRLDAMIASLEKNLDTFEKKQEENARKSAEAAKKAADEQEKANKRMSDAAKKAADEQEKSHKKVAQALRTFSISFVVTVAAIVKGYEAIKKEAARIGDEESLAGFNAVDNALSNLRDTLDAVALAALPIRESLDFIASGLDALSRVATLASAGIVKVAVLGLGISKFVQDFKYGIVSIGDIGAEFQKTIDLAQKAGENIIIAGATAPGRSIITSNAAAAAMEADRQRQKDTQAIYDYYKKAEELTIKSGESILEAEKDYHAKSAEARSSYMEKVSDITAKGIQKRAELAREYSDNIASAETDYQRAIEDANYQHGKKLADIERDYQRTIQNIQQSYQEDSLDAIRNLDAIALIRAKEKRDKDLANAETSRNDANAAEGENYSRQLYEAQRAFEDKRREAELAYQRGLEEQKRAEAEALQAAKDAYNQQTTDARNAYNEKLRTIQQAYNNENAAAQAQYGYSEAAYRDHLQRMQAITAAYGIGAGVSTRGAGTLRRRQEGGLDIVSSPTQFLAGEAGPEMVFTAPLNRSVPVMTPQIVEHTGDFQHSIDSTIRSSVAGIDGRIVAAVSKVLREVLG